MRCFVTAGPTWEPLDKARRLTNFSTGTLGGELANALAAAGHAVELFLSETAVWGAPLAAVRVHAFSTTASLVTKIQSRATQDPACFFHAAAVSDFTGGVAYQRCLDGSFERLEEDKWTTRSGKIWVELDPTPKILPQLRNWFPQGILLGWKYEVDGGRPEALSRARDQIRSAKTQGCVVNGPAWGSGFGILDSEGGLQECGSRADLIQELVQRVNRRTL